MLKPLPHIKQKKIADTPVLQVSERFYLYKKLPIEFQISGYTYVGKGKQTNKWCGVFKPVKHDIHACECGKTHHHQSMNCKKLECPICLKDSSYNRGLKITERIMYAQAYFGGYVYHVSINPTKRQQILAMNFDVSNEKYKTSIEKFEQEIIIPYVKERFEGAILIFHPDRINDKKNVRESSPHWHIIALTNKKYPFSPYDKLNMRKEKKYSFVVKFHKNKYTKKYWLNKFDDILNVAGYQLSHSAYSNGSIAYRGFGYLSGSKIRVRDEFIEYTEIPLECKHCKSPLYKVIEYEIDKYHYSPLVKNKIRKLESWLICNDKFKFDNREKLDELYELKELKILDTIKTIKIDKTNMLYTRKITDVKQVIIKSLGFPNKNEPEVKIKKYLKDMAPVNNDVAKWERKHQRVLKIRKAWNLIIAFHLGKTLKYVETRTIDFYNDKTVKPKKWMKISPGVKISS